MAKRRSLANQKRKNGPAALFGRFVKFCIVSVCIVVAIGLGYLGASLYGQLQDLPDITLVERYEPIEAIQIFDRNDQMVCTVEGDEDRRCVPLNQVSTQMQQAILAAEDHHFYEHNGINFLSIGRALQTNLKAGRTVQGGSTITQQLVKNLFFPDAGRTLDRKVKEGYMAWNLENKYGKERILEMYLNQIYFGNNAYGIERAAKRYFNKRAAELNLAESSFLAGLVKAPSELGDEKGRTKAVARQQEILDRMVEYGYITQKQGDEAKQTKLTFKKGGNPLQKHPHYISYVLELLRDRFSQAELRRQGLRVYTNLDPGAQTLAENILNERIKKSPKGISQGALVSVAVPDGAVIALVGGVGNFWTAQFNRATHPHTTGSSFKPFVYLTAFLRGTLSPDSIIEDTPLVVKQRWGLPDYAPKNFDHKFMGKIPVRTALMLSRNVPSVRTAQALGMESIIETARQAGITSQLDKNLSLALGSSSVSPLEMAGAYATFARAGVYITPQVLRKIENNRGQIIEVFEPKVDKVFPVEPVARLVSILQDVVKKGTGTAAKLKDRPVAGKTGTSNEARDVWFIGFTPDMVTAIWAGNDEHKPIPGSHITGGGLMAPTFKQFMEAYYQLRPHPAGTFVEPTPGLDVPAPTLENPDGLAANPTKIDDATKPDTTTSAIIPGDAAASPATSKSSSSQPAETAPVDPLLAPSAVDSTPAATTTTTTTTTSTTPAPAAAPTPAPQTETPDPAPGDNAAKEKEKEEHPVEP
ncbi:MAG: penicillin-binding protein [Candidatus Obscuribacterales bacterium]|nr:penicillin-binding protein [Candidatus Obscuribacterales bacterium]